LSSRTGSDVFIKLETLQPTFSFKLRGALNAVVQLTEVDGLPRELVTASAGNHGRALAIAAATIQIPLTVYVPADAPEVKLTAMRRAGARVITCGDYDEAERRAKDHAAATSSSYISPYSHADVIAGAGTIGLEILEDAPGIEAIVVPLGGGGLMSGVALAAAGRRTLMASKSKRPVRSPGDLPRGTSWRSTSGRRLPMGSPATLPSTP
jgi:threonine dehydratase